MPLQPVTGRRTGFAAWAHLLRALAVWGGMPLAPVLSQEGAPPPAAEAGFRVISQGSASGTYQAFPDLCRLPSGDLLCVFYAGYGHVSLPSESWPRGGRIVMVRSSDDGHTWSQPAVLFDGPLDDRDPHVAVLPDGSIACTFFTYQRPEKDTVLTDTCVVRSLDGGQTWEPEARVVCAGWPSSAPIRTLPDGTLVLGVYGTQDGQKVGGVIRSTDRGKTWSPPIPIGLGSGLSLDAETDVIPLTDGRLYAALRNAKGPMQFATSQDAGRSWSAPQSIGFEGHCPHFLRLGSGAILLTHRLPQTELHVSHDDAATWPEHHTIDQVIGAYPATVECRDGSIVVVYYTEGSGSVIRQRRFRLQDGRIDWQTP